MAERPQKPRSYASSRWLARLKNEGRPLLAYWIMTAYGLLVFSAVVLLRSPDGAALMILAGFALGTVGGQLIGNLLGYLRPRLWLVLAAIATTCGVWIGTGVGGVGAFAAVPTLAVAWFIAPFALASGFFAVRYRTEIFGAWIPVMYAVGSALILINSSDKINTWASGSKWAIWDTLTVPILGGALGLFVVYLVMRQASSLTQWQNSGSRSTSRLAANPRANANSLDGPTSGRARISWSTWGCMGLLALVLTVSTALISPFLFRTVERDGNGKGRQSRQEDGDGKGKGSKGKSDGSNGKGSKDNGSSKDGEGQDGEGSKGKGKDSKGKGSKNGDGKGSKGKGKGSNNGGKGKDGGNNKDSSKGKDDGEGKDSKNGDSKGSKGKDSDTDSSGGGGKDSKDDSDVFDPPEGDWDKVSEGVERATRQGASLLMLLIMLLAVLVVLYLVFWRPSRRLALTRHLENPAWPVPATQRIQDLWRRALIALEDIDIKTLDTEPATTLAARAKHELIKRYSATPEGLEEAAAIYTRVTFGIGLRPSDVTDMAAAVGLVTDYIEDRLKPHHQVRNLYRGIDRWER